MTTIDGIELVKVPGNGEWLGWGGAHYAFGVYVERGTVRRRRKFAREVEAILGDPRSWIRGGKVAFRRVDEHEDTQLILATPDSVDELCYPLDTNGEVSCCQGTKVVINVERWKHAVPHWTGSIETYRQMVINHEFGHRIGKPHRWCGGAGQAAPVMQQQTYSLQGCLANSWPLQSEL